MTSTMTVLLRSLRSNLHTITRLSSRTTIPQRCLRSVWTICGVNGSQRRVAASPPVGTRHFRRAYSNSTPECINIQDAEQFETEVLASSKPVILQFHATWCMPCKKLAPVLERMLESKQADLLYAKVDIDVLAEVALQYEVQSVPTVLCIKNGKVEDRFTGAQDEDMIRAFIDKLVP